MADWISQDEDLRKHEERGKFNLGKQKLFGIIREVCRKTNRSKPETVLPTCETIKALKDYQAKFEQMKSEAFAHLYHQARTY